MVPSTHAEFKSFLAATLLGVRYFSVGGENQKRKANGQTTVKRKNTENGNQKSTQPVGLRTIGPSPTSCV